uniref:Vesicle transport protein SEC20-like n=1 Tax=Phallusia mammillata TaxID=59560 RepID=A0A6F9D8G3_9ASCI|nr:vesicle transport protein SEC20-like [Phallusia mammillata]
MSWAQRISHPKTIKETTPEQCKEDIVKLNCKVKAIIQDIYDCKGPLDALTDLNATAQSSLADLRGKISLLDDLSNEVDHERVRVDLKQLAQNQFKLFQNTQATLRKANLACKLAIDNKEKDVLLGSREARKEQLRHRQKVSDNKAQMMHSASDVTESLMSISRKMEDTVQQSSTTLHSLVTSSNTITETNEELKSQSGLIQTGHRLLTKYNRREFTDKILLLFALALFFSTVVYILKRRLFPS